MEPKIIQVHVREEPSATEYLRDSPNKKSLAELLKGVRDIKNWALKTDKNRTILSASPIVPGHPGHIDGKNWKMYIERGRQTRDRLILKDRAYEIIEKAAGVVHVKIKCSARVETDTH